MIEVENLTKRYGPHTAVEGISFRVEKGEILGFLGPNGAGKTTTMRILTCFQPATSGSARVAGYDVFDSPLDVKRRVGYLPETPPLYPDMRVRTFLDFVAKIKGVPASERRTRIAETMEKTRVADVQDKMIGRLSKGYRQRVGLAQAILHNPDVLILDEPTSGLDPKQIIETRDLIKSLGKEHTIILSTHILPEVSMTCGRVVIINKGRVVAEGTPDDLVRRLQGADALRVEVRGAAPTVEAAVAKVPGVRSVRLHGETDGISTFEVEAESGRDIRAEVARAVVDGRLDLLGLQRTGMSLEEIFLHLTTSDSARSPEAESAPAPAPESPSTEVTS